ncbi:hypothetical protein ACHAXR_007413 [Thalassiosira sp. AJA248-18]
MRFTLFKISAFALGAACMVSAEKPGEKEMPQLRGAVSLARTSDTDVDGVMSPSTSSETESSEDFFPEPEDEMDEDGEGRTREYSSSSTYPSNKKSAAQKRQESRDERRSKNNPHRSQHEEQRERERKDDQARNRSKRCVDPSEPGCGNDNYPRNREAKRQYKCDKDGTDCDYRRVHPKDEPNHRRADKDKSCMERCDERYRSDSDYDRCVRRDCAGEKYKNGATTFGEYMAVLAQEKSTFAEE